MSYPNEPQSEPAIPLLPEQDQAGGDSLPTYDALAEQHGPNSRFGRWQKWIEKRAAERYADLTTDELQRRRNRGWGDGLDVQPEQATSVTTSSITTSRPDSTPKAPTLTLQTDFSNTTFASTTATDLPPIPTEPASLIPEPISPSCLRLYNFGSRFLPHTTCQIQCLLPVLNNQALLIGHDRGLSVMDMFPREWTEHGIIEKGPADAEVKPVWEGQAVYQMSILEAESTGQGMPQGVVLALVGPEADSTEGGVRSLRMYNLASLVNLAKWAITQRGRPLNLKASHAAGKHSHGRKHRQQSSLTKGLKNLVIDSPIAQPHTPPDTEPESSYLDVADAPLNKRLPSRPSSSQDSVDSTESWDAMDDMDMPLLWAAHYTPLAPAGTRLHNASVLFYDYYRNEAARSRGGALLAVATKANIFLYEAPKGERAFHLVKEFYTPLTARSITFVQQSVVDSMSRSASDVLPRAGGLSASSRHARVVSMNASTHRYQNQLSLFVIFEKKAGLIRIADSAVGEVDLYEDSGMFLSPSVNAAPGSRKSRTSWDGRGFVKESKGVWAAPAKATFPTTADQTVSQSVYVLTRGRVSHIVPYPLPPSIAAVAPLRILTWSSPPACVSCRVYFPTRRDEDAPLPFLQVVAFGEDGLEVQEVPLSSLSEPERKGKRRESEPVRAIADVGGEAGYLCADGYWSRSFYQSLVRSDSVESNDSETSISDWSHEAIAEKMRAHLGMYGWVRKGLKDWRVFWVGGTTTEQESDEIYA